MRYIQNKSTNSYINLALEEYILKEFTEDYFLIYRNEPSVIIGKHQNALAEINLDFVNTNDIKVVRRLSGGGAVYHDLGNLNYSFISNSETGNHVNFKKFSQPILEVLNNIGVPAMLEGKSDLKINGLKFSGNAEHVYKNRVLHHGTLLFSSELNLLKNALADNSQYYYSKAVKSNRSSVTNISTYLKENLNIAKFKDFIKEYIKENNPGYTEYFLSPKDFKEIENLVNSKYATWEWNYGYAPDYFFQKKIKTKSGDVKVELEVVKGIIIHAKIESSFLDKNHIFNLNQMLVGLSHHPETLGSSINQIENEKQFDLMQAFF
jgi:lipoate-protein ligase A